MSDYEEHQPGIVLRTAPYEAPNTSAPSGAGVQDPRRCQASGCAAQLDVAADTARGLLADRSISRASPFRPAGRGDTNVLFPSPQRLGGKDGFLVEPSLTIRDMPLRDIIKRMRHDGCGGRAGTVELLTGIEGVTSRPVRRIRLME